MHAFGCRVLHAEMAIVTPQSPSHASVRTPTVLAPLNVADHDRRYLLAQQANKQQITRHARAQAQQEDVAQMDMQDTAEEHDRVTDAGETGGYQAPAPVAFGPGPGVRAVREPGQAWYTTTPASSWS